MTVRPSLGTPLDLYRTRSGRENRKIKIKISKTKEAGDGPYFNSRGGVFIQQAISIRLPKELALPMRS